MELVSIEEFQRRIEHYLGCALIEPVMITSNGREWLVMMSVEEYRRLKRRDRRVMTLDDFTDEDLEAIRKVEAPVEATAFNHEVVGVNMTSDGAAAIRDDRDTRGAGDSLAVGFLVEYFGIPTQGIVAWMVLLECFLNVIGRAVAVIRAVDSDSYAARVIAVNMAGHLIFACLGRSSIVVEGVANRR